MNIFRDFYQERSSVEVTKVIVSDKFLETVENYWSALWGKDDTGENETL